MTGSLAKKSLTILSTIALSILFTFLIASVSHDVLAEHRNSSIIAELDPNGPDQYFITIIDPDGIDYASLRGSSTDSVFFRIGPDFCDEDINVLGPLSVRVTPEEFPLVGHVKDCQEPASINIHGIPIPKNNR